MESSRQKSVRLRGGVASVCWLLAAVVCLLGCNQGKQLQRDLVQRELRLQEDEIYRLEDYLEEYQRKVCHLRAENQQLLRQLADAPKERGAASTSSADDRGGDGNGLDLPRDQDPTPLEDGAPELPVIDFGTPSEAPPAPADISPTPSDEGPPPFKPAPAPSAGGAAPPFVPEEIASPTTISPTSFGEEPEERGITNQEPPKPVEPRSLALVGDAAPLLSPATPRLVGVRVLGRPGPDEPDGQPTLLVLATPLGDNKQPLEFAGEASVMLRDPAAEPGRRNLARWDFTRPEVVDASGLSGRSAEIEFLIGLPEGLPAGRPVELWVRLVDDQGGKTLGLTTVRLPSPAPTTTPAALAETKAPVTNRSGWSETARPSGGIALPPPLPEPELLRPPLPGSLPGFSTSPPRAALLPRSEPRPTDRPPRPATQSRRAASPRQAAPSQPAALTPGWHNPRVQRTLPADPAAPRFHPQGNPAPTGASFQGAALAPRDPTVRMVTHDAPLPFTQHVPPPLPTNPWQQKGRDAGASRPVDNLGITFTP